MFEKAASKLEPDVRLLKLNADAAPKASQRYGIRSIPTLLLIRNQKLIAQASGVMESERIVEWARGNLKASSRSGNAKASS
jgi:thioredoxin 2